MAQEYELIVIGGGSAGLVSAKFAGKMGLKTALVEKEHIGGDCTWAGCVPSKALLHVAKTAHAARTGAAYGVLVDNPRVDMAKVRDYVQGVIQGVYQHETPEVVYEEAGVETFLGGARFLDPHTIEVDLNDGGTQTLTGKRFVIATGAKPRILPIPGIEDVDYHTNLTLFDNDTLPERMVTIGAGPIGMEMSQAYARLGAQVTVVSPEIMMNDDPLVGEKLRELFEREGVQFVVSAVDRVYNEDGHICVDAGGQTIPADMLLLATGRTPNVASLDLDKAGVKWSKHGIEVDSKLRTTAEHIFAAGDVNGGPQFTHYAGMQGSVAARNALLPGSSNGKPAIFPWTTFTEPEAAHVGLKESDAREKYGSDYKVKFFSLAEGDRSQTEDDKDGFIKLIHRNGKLLGATVVSKRAGEMINEYAIAITNGWGVGDLSNTIHSYPSYGDMVAGLSSKMKVEQLFSGFTGKMWDVARRVLYS